MSLFPFLPFNQKVGPGLISQGKHRARQQTEESASLSHFCFQRPKPLDERDF